MIDQISSPLRAAGNQVDQSSRPSVRQPTERLKRPGHGSWQKPVDHLEDCFTGCHLVLVPAGMPQKPGMTRDDLFGINADIAKGIVEACAKFCPDAVLGMIVNPVNSVVPAMAELYRRRGLDPLKIVGITTLDVVRAN